MMEESKLAPPGCLYYAWVGEYKTVTVCATPRPVELSFCEGVVYSCKGDLEPSPLGQWSLLSKSCGFSIWAFALQEQCGD